jgi:alpha-galactosidase
MISYNSEKQIFKLDTKNTSYIIGMLRDTVLLNLYYGKKLKNFDYEISDLAILGRAHSSVEAELFGAGHGETHSLDFSTFGNADLRLPTLHLKYADGSVISRFRYRNHKIYAGKPLLEGLPATYVEDSSEADTLELELFDEISKVSVTLIYTAFNNVDAIARSMRVKNESENSVEINRIMSATLDIQSAARDFDMLHLDGAWARERYVRRQPIFKGNQEISSTRGISSAQHNPFFAMVHKNATELNGEVYGFNLIYSGNFTAGVECDVYDTTRAYIGINPFTFNWKLESGEEFQSPEAVLTYSTEGISGMSRIYHKLYRTRLCRGKFRDIERYALINNWEGTYFTFNEEKLVDIAKKGAEIGLDLFVLDDGWFGKRDNDKCSLGDWFVNYEKLPNGLDGLANKINDLGMKFGLWFEPEMVSPDSDLFRAHPDWAMGVEGRSHSLGRSQLVLDLSRKDVCEYIINVLSDILENANIEYVKWDMNKSFSEFGSFYLDAEHQGELCHRYMLGLYNIMETLTTRFPNILWEGCASGGARFDGGILHYMPQIWTSDCSDAGERMQIQYGTSIVYPFSSMGSHVSAIPNHQAWRDCSMETRGDMAAMGQFGYELDMSKMTDEDIEKAKEQVKFYKKYGEVFHKGDLYRLRSPFDGNEAVLEFISEDKNTVILNYANRLCNLNNAIIRVKLAGLDPDAIYVETDAHAGRVLYPDSLKIGREFTGEYLMNYGLKFVNFRDFQTAMRVFIKK